VEVDPEVIGIAERYFDFTPSSCLHVHVADARNFINAAAGGKKYHIVYLDAFDSFSIPSHITTREFNRRDCTVKMAS
jgi:spermidine synthase